MTKLLPPKPQAALLHRVKGQSCLKYLSQVESEVSHTSKFSKTFYCKCHKGEVYIIQQSFTSMISESQGWEVNK